MSDRVGFIGLGAMGLPMATNLAKGGFALTVYDVSPAAATAVRRTGTVSVANSAEEVAQQSEVVFTCLPNDAIVRQVYLGPGGIAAGGHSGLTTCDCSTVSPEMTREISTALKSRGIPHLDTPRLGSQPQAVEGQIFFIVGGEEAQVERISPYLKAMGKLHMYVGGSGVANQVKLIHNGLLAMSAVAVAEALALCVQSDVSPLTFYEVVRNGGGMAYGTYFERRAKRILTGEFSPTFKLALMRKDATMAMALAKQLAVPTPVLEESIRTYDEAMDAGWGDEDFSAVTHVIEKRIGRKLSE